MRQAMRMIGRACVCFMVAAAMMGSADSAKAQSKTQAKAKAKPAVKIQAPARSTATVQAQMLRANAPLVFEPNQGQAPANVRWIATPARADVSAFTRPVAPQGVKSSVVKMQLAGSGAWKGDGGSPTGGISNYYLGNSPANWHRKIPHYAQVKASGVYKGIDVVFHGDRGALEYDFVVAPGADPKQIGLQFTGGSGPRMDKGDLVLTTPGGNELRHVQPTIQQQMRP